MGGDQFEPVGFESGGEAPDCPRCSNPGLISAVCESTVAVLCAGCDVDDPAAGALITFFAVHGSITDDTVEEVTPLLQTWARAARPRWPQAPRNV